MRVLILGEDAPGGLMGSYERAFAELGIETQTFCLARAYDSSVPGIRARALRRVAEPVVLSTFNENVARHLTGVEVDLVLVIKGHRLSPGTIRRLRESAGAPVVNFFPDDPFSKERSNRLAYGPDVLTAYDACFTFARHLIPEYERAGVGQVQYLPFARDPALHTPVASPPNPAFDVVFVGSCTNSRLSDLREAARVLHGRRIASGVRMLVVPGSEAVRRDAEREGLHHVFTAAGAEWRVPGCSMCIAMNGDLAQPGQLVVSTSNRNFEGRQGKGARTVLASPATAAASAIAGRIADPREYTTQEQAA